jgi:hypothetical protein
MQEVQMRKNLLELIAAGGAIAAISGVALATYMYRNSHRSYTRKFDKNTVEEVEGRVEDILYSGRENGEDKGVEFLLRAGDELLPVHVGPAWYMDHQKEKIKAGDKIRVKGSRVNVNHEPVLIAETIVNSDLAFRLRDSDGHPVWNALTRL